MELDKNPENEEIYKIMGWVVNAKPQVDAYTAYQNGDHKFFAIQRHHRISIPSYELMCAEWSNDITERERTLTSRVKYIKGAGYGAKSYEHKKLNAIAELYIDSYNSTLWFHLQDSNEFKCSS